MRQGSKAFFFEKKKQKAFVCAVADRWSARLKDVHPTEIKVIFFFFLKKKALLACVAQP